MKISEALKRIRNERGMTQEGLALVSGLGKNTVIRIELGKHKPRRDTILMLAKALGVGQTDLCSTLPVE